MTRLVLSVCLSVSLLKGRDLLAGRHRIRPAVKDYTRHSLSPLYDRGLLLELPSMTSDIYEQNRGTDIELGAPILNAT